MFHSPFDLEWPKTVRRVTKDEILRAFNKGEFWEQAKSRVLKVRLFKERHADPVRTGQPYCTRTQMLVYSTQDGDPIALVHQYLRPNGTVGASGKPSPKKLVIDNELLTIRAK
jgi:hypothetical protein